MTDDGTGGPAGDGPEDATPERSADRAGGERSFRPSPARIIVWVVVAGVGIYLIASGIVGMIAKA